MGKAGFSNHYFYLILRMHDRLAQMGVWHAIIEKT